MMRNLYEAVVRPTPPAIQASEVDRPTSPENSQSYFQVLKRNVTGFFASGNNKDGAEDKPEADPGAIVAFKEQNKEEIEKEKIVNVLAAAKAVRTKTIKVGPDLPASVKETKSCATETKPSSADENGPASKVATPKTAKKLPKSGSTDSGKAEPSSGDERSLMVAATAAKTSKKMKKSSSSKTEEVEQSSGDEKESPSMSVEATPVKPRVVRKAKSVESTSTKTAASPKSREAPPPPKVRREMEKPLAVLFSDEHSESDSDSFSSSSSSEEHRVPAKPSNLKKPPQNGRKRKGPKKRVRFKRKIKEVREFYS